jgi:CHAT domain-containing protein
MSPQAEPHHVSNQPRYRISLSLVLLSVALLILLRPATITLAHRVSIPQSHSSQQLFETGAVVQQESKPDLLEPGKPIERELAGGESHSYGVALVAGQFCQAVVDQRDIDVVVALYGTDGGKIVQVDSPNEEKGPEQVSLIAEVSGTYRLEVRSLGKNAPRGRYELRLVELRAATRQDQSRITAQKASADAKSLRNQRTRESQRQAIEKYREAILLWHTLGDLRMEAYSLFEMGLIQGDLGEYQNALDSYGQAREIFKRLQDLRGEGGVLSNMGWIREGVDQTLLERERSLRQTISDKAERQRRLLAGKHTDAQAAAAAKELDALTVDYEQVQARIKQTSPRYSELTQPLPLTLAEIQKQVLDGETLLLEYSLGDERSFLWMATPTSIRSFELPGRAEIERAARRLFEALTARNRIVPNETPSQRRQRWERAADEYPKASAALSQILLGPVAPDLGKLRLLVVGEGVLQYIPFAALPEPLPIPLNRANGTGQGEENASLTSSERPPLIEQHEVITLPSASVLAVLRQETAERKPAEKTIAVFADPVFETSDPRVQIPGKDQGAAAKENTEGRDVKRSATESGLRDLVRLRFSRQEANQIVSFAPEGKKFEALDFAANRAAAISADLRHYAILHFATHGLINNQNPELSGVVLSLVDEQGRPQNGFLRLYDIYNLKLDADLVVLSACQTALGKEIKGEGLVGLTRGFMYAGAPRVVASLWQIEDRVTAELMTRFYEAMLRQKLCPAAALRAAQISMSKDRRWQTPYNWAAFTFQGEWK